MENKLNAKMLCLLQIHLKFFPNAFVISNILSLPLVTLLFFFLYVVLLFSEYTFWCKHKYNWQLINELSTFQNTTFVVNTNITDNWFMSLSNSQVNLLKVNNIKINRWPYRKHRNRFLMTSFRILLHYLYLLVRLLLIFFCTFEIMTVKKN